jgi:hypothetical protein
MRGNGIRHETTTTGTGAVTLTGVTGWPGYEHVFGTSGTIFVEYTIVNSDGVPIEGGIGSLVLSTMVLTRTRPEFTWNGAAYSAVPSGPLSLAAGTKTVICSLAAERFAPAQWLYGNSPLSGATSGNVPLLPWSSGANRAINQARSEAWLYPWINSRPFDRVTVKTSAALTGGPTSVSFAVAIYESLETGLPGRRLALFDTWTTNPLVNTAQQTSDALGSPIFLPNGYYWIAFLGRWTGGSGSPALVGGAPPVVPWNAASLGGNGRNQACIYKNSETSLTDPFPTSSLSGGEFAQAPIYIFGT